MGEGGAGKGRGEAREWGGEQPQKKTKKRGGLPHSFFLFFRQSAMAKSLRSKVKRAVRAERR